MKTYSTAPGAGQAATIDVPKCRYSGRASKSCPAPGDGIPAGSAREHIPVTSAPTHAECRSLNTNLKFGDGKNSAPFPSMVVIFDGDTRDGQNDQGGAAGMSKRDPVPVWEDIGPLEYADASVELKIRVYRMKGRYLWSDEYISVLKAIEAYRVLTGELMGKSIYEIFGEMCARQGFDIVYIDAEGYKETTVLVDVSGMYHCKE